jgi:hypothetical protein
VDVDVSAWAEAAVVPLAVGALSGWIGGQQAARRAVQAAAAQRRGAAAEALRDAVQRLHDLLWDRYTGRPVDGAAIADAMTEFERLTRRHEDLLPADARHLRRSTREVMACVFGGPAGAALHSGARELPTDAFDGYWADVSLTWFEHVVRRLHDWEDDPRTRRLDLVQYYVWRRDEDDAHRAAQADVAG